MPVCVAAYTAPADPKGKDRTRKGTDVATGKDVKGVKSDGSGHTPKKKKSGAGRQDLHGFEFLTLTR